MSTEFLQALASSSLPKQISGAADIDLLRLLVAAGMIEADLPDVDAGGVATVPCTTTPAEKSVQRLIRVTSLMT